MKKQRVMGYRALLLVWLSVILVGCGNSGEKQVAFELPVTLNRLQDLERSIDQGAIRNVSILKSYAQQLAEKRPEFKELTDQMMQEASTQGRLYQSLNERYQKVKETPDQFPDWQTRLTELKAIQAASQVDVFNDALSDPINVIADMSGGELSRVNSMSKEASLSANGSGDLGVGSQLIGNPTYGQWRTDNNGLSFWEWYGIYSLLDNIGGAFSGSYRGSSLCGNYYTRGRRVSYSDWSRCRSYSYYHDVGRNYYTSPRNRLEQQTVNQRTQKRFGRSGQSFTSPYAKKRVGSSGISKGSQAASKATFTSQYAKASQSNSRSSAYSSSSRRGSRSGSRFGGK